MPLTNLLNELDAEEAIPDGPEDEADEAAEEDVGAEDPAPPAPPGPSDLLALTDEDGDPLEIGDTFTELQVENVSEQEIDASQVFFPTCGGTISIVILLWTLDPGSSASYEFDCPQELTDVTDDPDAGEVDIGITTAPSGASTDTTAGTDAEEEIVLTNDSASAEPADVRVTQNDNTVYDEELAPGETEAVSVAAGVPVAVTIDGVTETFTP